MGSFSVNLQNATQNATRNLTPRFHGNENVEIDRELTEEALLDIFDTYRQNPQVKELVQVLAGQRWNITAGFHRGGLGGAAGGADQRDHITLSTGHHIRFDNTRRRLVEITGPNISPSEGRAAAAAAAAPPSTSEQEFERWTALGLNRMQALKAVQKFPTSGMTRTAFAEQIKKNSAQKK